MLAARKIVLVRTLLLSNDIQLIEVISQVAQEMAIHLEPCCDAQLAMGRLCHVKFEGVMVDLDFEGGIEFLGRVRTLTSNRSAVSFAILGQRLIHADAFQGGVDVVIERPLCTDAIHRVLKASYPLMVREKRRYFRFPLQVEVAVARGRGTEFKVTSLNLSESGICLNSAEPLGVGDKLRLRLRLPGEPRLLNLLGQVCWSEATGRVGVQFSNLNPGVAHALRTWLAQRLEELMVHSHEQLEQAPGQG
jgi:hypothetical protein